MWSWVDIFIVLILISPLISSCIAQVGNSSTESNLWGPGGWQIAESHWSDEGQQHTVCVNRSVGSSSKKWLFLITQQLWGCIWSNIFCLGPHSTSEVVTNSLGEGCYYQLAGGLGCTSHRERLMELNFLSLQRQKGCYYCYCQLFNGDNREDATRLLSE